MKNNKNIKLLSILILLILAFQSETVLSQCTNTSSYGSATAPTGTSAVTISTCNYQTEYSTISGVVAGSQYQATYDLGGYITVHSGSSGGPVVASGNAPLTWTAAVSGTHYIHYNTNSSCGTSTGCGTSTLSCVSCGGGTPAPGSCLDALPFCTSNAYTFPASTNVADMGSVGCLFTTPNPAWYWMEIGAPGNIDIYMTSGGDVDFIAWGPFTSLSAACASSLMTNPGVDCSYSTAAQETANLINTQAGDVYVLLITNYANIVTNISFSQTSGAGSTNCGIIAPPIANNGPLCAGQTLQLTVSNPTAGATYLWSGPGGWSSNAMNPTIANVTTANAGTYSLAITVGASTSPPVTTDVVISANVTPTFTAGGTYCSGAVVPAFPTTSTNGITGSWSPAINNTATTTYTFTPTAGQCATTTTNSITITPNTTPTFTAVGPYCSGSSIPALPTTSTNGITGTWSPAINNAATTTYTFTPTAGQCATTTTLQITITPLTIPTFTAQGPYCAGATITALPTTSNNGINGTWSPAINNSSTTIYTFMPTAGQCANSTTLTITINPNILPSFASTPDYCNGATIPALPTTSTNGITGSWSPAINNTATTTYTFTPTAGQCALSTTHSIVVNANILPAFTQAGPYCFGTIVPPLPATSVNGITGSWSPAINNTVTTDYTFTPNAGQCASTTQMQIEIESVAATVLFTTDRFCDVAGTAGVSGVGGTPSYSYIWPSNALGVSGGTANNLNAGNYTVTISDANGCQATQALTINFTNNMTSIATIASQPSCAGDANGSVNVAISNATQPFSIYWGTGNIISNLANYSISGLSQGSYTITVIDSNGCDAVSSIILTDPTQLLSTATFIPIKCFGESASVTISASGGTPSYTGTGNFSVNSGNYNYTVIDSHNCESVISVTIPAAPTAITINSTVNDVSCYNMGDGSISLVTIGGTPPYNYDWDDNSSNYILTGLGPDIYSVTVTDYNLCTQTKTFEIYEPKEMEFDFAIENLMCYGAANGSVLMTASGGLEPYRFEVYNNIFNAIGANQTNLAAGNYTIKVQDANSCSKTNSISISSPAEIELAINTSHPSCIGNSDGSVEIIVNGGTEPYSYIFNEMFFDINLIGSLKEGVYNVEVKDANNCVGEIKNIVLTDVPVDCIIIPNAFTPNADGINDTWVIENIDRFPQSVTQVFNRWGQTVYFGSPDDNPWDGYFDGKRMPAGTYVFYLSLFNGQPPYTGVVTVVQ
jgi:gliding motility-associated-like protein